MDKLSKLEIIIRATSQDGDAVYESKSVFTLKDMEASLAVIKARLLTSTEGLIDDVDWLRSMLDEESDTDAS